jgi:hypothetical protein
VSEPERYSPDVGDRVAVRGKVTHKRYDGKVLAVFEEPTVLIERPDGSYVVVVRDDMEWREEP